MLSLICSLVQTYINATKNNIIYNMSVIIYTNKLNLSKYMFLVINNKQYKYVQNR